MRHFTTVVTQHVLNTKQLNGFAIAALRACKK